MVKKADGQQYPKNPDNGYVSRHPTTFRGCLGCGQLGHLFKACLQNKNLEVRANYWQELWCHIPATRKKNSTMRDDRMSRNISNNPSVMYMATQKSTSGPLGRGQGVNTPSWMSNQRSSSPPNQNKAPEDKNP